MLYKSILYDSYICTKKSVSAFVYIVCTLLWIYICLSKYGDVLL